MNRIRTKIGLVLTILAVLALSTAAPASAYYHAGDCSKAYVISYEHADYGGRWVKTCYGTTDGSFTGGFNGISGYYNDNWHDMVSSFKARIFVSNVGICFYKNDQFSNSTAQYAYSVDVSRLDAFNNDTFDSFNWGSDWNNNGYSECSS